MQNYTNAQLETDLHINMAPSLLDYVSANIHANVLKDIFDDNSLNHRACFTKNNVNDLPMNDIVDGVDIGQEESLCKKHFLDIMTEFISKESSFKDTNQENISRFQYLINTTFNKIIDKYKLELKMTTNPGLLETDILFTYKGGTTIKLIFNKYRELFNDFENYVELETYFQRSDSDYSIFINPSLHNFDTIYRKINKISAI
jgi:hypothetical protein